MTPQDTIPVVDLFAGPGGLGEGFAAYQAPDGRQPLKVVLSIEKDYHAHQTLQLRAFYREFPQGKAPAAYYDHLRNTEVPEPVRRRKLFDAHPEEAQRATAAALHAELGSPASPAYLLLRQKVARPYVKE